MEKMDFREIVKEDDPALAEIIRYNLKKHGLDIPGTAYFDESLSSLSEYYLSDRNSRFYYTAADENGTVSGGVGLAECDLFDECAEMQKLYLSDEAKGAGMGYKLISLIEDKAKELGYKRIYLETHDDLKAAIHVYKKCGYKEIKKPEGIVHSAMNRFFIKELYE